MSFPRPLGEYTLARYLAYLFYLPLHVAGPTSTANAFLSHLERPQTSHSVRQVAFYGARVVFALFLMEVITHLLPCFAIARSGQFGNLAPLGYEGSTL